MFYDWLLLMISSIQLTASLSLTFSRIHRIQPNSFNQITPTQWLFVSQQKIPLQISNTILAGMIMYFVWVFISDLWFFFTSLYIWMNVFALFQRYQQISILRKFWICFTKFTKYSISNLTPRSSDWWCLSITSFSNFRKIKWFHLQFKTLQTNCSQMMIWSNVLLVVLMVF